MENSGKTANPDKPVEKPSSNGGMGFVGYIKRRAQERKAKKKAEQPADRAARRTANATYWIAVFTIVLAGTSILQWHELHTGGADTHDLAIAAGNQATWTQHLADSTKTQADRTKDLADQMKLQADRTKIIADEALVQAQAARIAANAAQSSANTAAASTRPWIKITGIDLRPGIRDIKTLMFHWPASGLEYFPQFAGKELPPILQIKTSLANIGHTPAEKVDIVPEIFFHRFDSNTWHNLVIDEEQRFCKSVLHRPTSTAALIFPEQPFESSGGISGVIKDTDIDRQPSSPARYTSAAVIVCVNYTGVQSTPYQTQAWFGLYEDNLIQLPVGVDVDSDHLRLIREDHGDHAY